MSVETETPAVLVTEAANSPALAAPPRFDSGAPLLGLLPVVLLLPVVAFPVTPRVSSSPVDLSFWLLSRNLSAD